MEGIYLTCEDVRFLKSYRRADGAANQIALNAADNDFWVAWQGGGNK